MDEAAAAPSGYSSSPRASSLRASPKGPRPFASPLRGGGGGGGLNGGLSGPLLTTAAAAQDVHYADPYAQEPAGVANGHARLKEEHDDMEELEVVGREDKAGGSGAAAAESGASGAAAGLVGGSGMEFIEKIHLPAGAERTVRRANRCLDCGPRLWARMPGLGGAKGTYANVTLLALCWALSYSTITSTLTTTAVAARALIADQGWVTLAVGAVFIGSAVIVVPVALSMHLFGRRIGFMIGCAMGMLGAGLSTAAMYRGNFALLVVGSLLLGGALGHAQFYRFAAADVSTLHFRSKAISLVLAGGIIAAVLSKSTRNWIPEHEFAGTYISMILLFAANLLPLFFIDFSTPEEVEPAELEEWFKKAATITTDGVVVKLRLKHYRSDEQTGPARSLIAILLQPECLVSILLASLAYGAMLFIMTPLPLAMIERSFSFNQAALVIQLHMLAMFIPALFTGHLMSTFGTFAVTLTGNVLFVVAIIFMITGQHYFNYMVGMLFLGVAWNFMFIGATNRFTTTYRFSETSKAQALNDTLVSGAAAVASVFSGSARDDLGWKGVQWLALIFLVLGIVLSVGLQLVHSINKRKKGLTDRRWSGERNLPA
eukprot:jgi/Chlat1/1276/Chrsp117S01701